jgi:predicted lipid-binding transport protein (Tim44 family)
VFEAVIFAMIAAFLGFRLYAVLGRRTEGEQQRVAPPAEDVLVKAPKTETNDDAADASARALPPESAPYDGDDAIRGIRAILEVDSRFSAADFVEGATSAYEMILENFWKGDLDAVSALVSEEVRASFAEAIAAREAANEVLDNRLVRIDRASIATASVEKKVAQITVRFDADIAAVTRDKDGKVIAGSLTDAIPTHDAWTFQRDLKSANPNWILIDTDEAE